MRGGLISTTNKEKLKTHRKKTHKFVERYTKDHAIASEITLFGGYFYYLLPLTLNRIMMYNYKVVLRF